MTKTLCLSVLTTGQRLQGLKDCVQSILEMRPAAQFEIELLIVHNGPDRLDEVRALFGVEHKAHVPIRIIHEEKRGIPFARNAALDYGVENGFDYLGFIDDDGIVDPDWCVQMASMFGRSDVDAVTGPQIPVFPEGSEERFRGAQIYRERRLPEGARTSWAATNNVVFSLKLVREFGLAFTENLHAGGEDKEFFLQYTAAGGEIVWTSTAVVREVVPFERQTNEWVRERALRYGFNGHKIDMLVCDRSKAIGLAMIKCMLYLFKTVTSAFLALGRSNHHLLDTMAYFNHAKGYWLSLQTKDFAVKYA